MPPDPAVLERWNGAAFSWEKNRETIRQMFNPVTHALAAAANVGKQNTVLDIATGPGEPALGLAVLVGPQGKVFGIDPIPGMVAAARRASERFALANAQFAVALAHPLPFPDASFDAVVSRFGVMFFPSPVDALREMLRVLQPGRKLALAVWHTPEKNPFFHIIQNNLDRYAPAPPLAPDAADAFRFAAPGKLSGILAEAGAIALSEHLFQFAIEAHISVEDFWSLRCEMSEKLRERLATLPPEQLAEVKHRSLDALREYSTRRGMTLPAEVLIVSGTAALG